MYELTSKEVLVILVSSVLLGLSVSYLKGSEILVVSLVCFFVIISINTLVKKLVAYYYETDLFLNFWSVYRYGLREDAHFKEPVPMVWVPIFFTMLTNGAFWWLSITQFSVKIRPERVARRHGRFSYIDIDEWHLAMIALSGVVANLVLGFVFYLIGTFEYFLYFAQLNMLYAVWSLVPISGFDGTKIFFASKALWFLIGIITLILTVIVFSV